MFFGNTLLAILHLEIAKNLFAAGSAEQLNSPQVSRHQSISKVDVSQWHTATYLLHSKDATFEFFHNS